MHLVFSSPSLPSLSLEHSLTVGRADEHDRARLWHPVRVTRVDLAEEDKEKRGEEGLDQGQVCETGKLAQERSAQRSSNTSAKPSAKRNGNAQRKAGQKKREEHEAGRGGRGEKRVTEIELR